MDKVSEHPQERRDTHKRCLEASQTPSQTSPTEVRLPVWLWHQVSVCGGLDNWTHGHYALPQRRSSSSPFPLDQSRWRRGAGPGIPAGTEGRGALEASAFLTFLARLAFSSVHRSSRCEQEQCVLALGDSGSTLVICVFDHLSRLVAGNS